jgi:hypothetical protein
VARPRGPALLGVGTRGGAQRWGRAHGERAGEDGDGAAREQQGRGRARAGEEAWGWRWLAEGAGPAAGDGGGGGTVAEGSQSDGVLGGSGGGWRCGRGTGRCGRGVAGQACECPLGRGFG